MSDACVVDSSVAVKWFVDEEGSDVARDLRALTMYAPALIIVEVANALWVKTRRRDLTADQAMARLKEMRRTPLTISADESLVEEASHLAATLSHPVYDCLYLVLARLRGLPLLTADSRLARAAGAAAKLKTLVLTLDQVVIVGNRLQIQRSTSN